eukprot:5615496-Prorocentrum_lima.AAC.1
MTSSLVGSEMCIRDRTITQHDWASNDVDEDEAPLQPVHAARSRSARGGPVSYTHLTLPTICSV